MVPVVDVPCCSVRLVPAPGSVWPRRPLKGKTVRDWEVKALCELLHHNAADLLRQTLELAPGRVLEVAGGMLMTTDIGFHQFVDVFTPAS